MYSAQLFGHKCKFLSSNSLFCNTSRDNELSENYLHESDNNNLISSINYFFLVEEIDFCTISKETIIWDFWHVKQIIIIIIKIKEMLPFPVAILSFRVSCRSVRKSSSENDTRRHESMDAIAKVTVSY
jgi:hypothetical protein